MKKICFTGILTLLLFGVVGCGTDSGSSKESDAYPERNIEILVGHGEGGGTDIFARTVAKELEDILDTKVQVVNKEGGPGLAAIQEAYNNPADGYSLVAISAFPITTAAGSNEYGLDEFTPLARFQNDTYGLWVDPDKYEDVDEFIQDAEDNPGEVKVGGTGTLSLDDITVHELGEEAGVEFNFVPVDGAGDMYSDLLGGHTDAMVEEFGPAQDLYEDDEIKPLAVFSEERLEDFPDLPTSEEMGWDLFDGNERGFIIKDGTDPDIVEKLEEAMKKAYESEDYQQYEKENYLDLRDGWMDSEEYEERLEESIGEFEEIVPELDSQK